MLRAGGTKKVSPPLPKGRERDSHRQENANFQGGAERLFTGVRGVGEGRAWRRRRKRGRKNSRNRNKKERTALL